MTHSALQGHVLPGCSSFWWTFCPRAPPAPANARGCWGMEMQVAVCPSVLLSCLLFCPHWLFSFVIMWLSTVPDPHWVQGGLLLLLLSPLFLLESPVRSSNPHEVGQLDICSCNLTSHFVSVASFVLSLELYPWVGGVGLGIVFGHQRFCWFGCWAHVESWSCLRTLVLEMMLYSISNCWFRNKAISHSPITLLPFLCSF